MGHLMYVDPFWAGVVVGALAMLALIVTLAATYGKRKG